MKILRVVARLNVGGPARHVVWLTRAMAAEGHSTLLVAGSVPPGESDMAYFAAQHGVTPVTIPEMSRELSVRDVVVVWKLFRLFWRERPHVVHSHTAKAGAVGRLAGLLYRAARHLPFAGRRPRPALVHTYHGHVFHSYYSARRTAAFLIIERLLARLATDRIIVISPQQLDDIHGRFRVGRREQFVITRLGLDLSVFDDCSRHRAPSRVELNVGADDVVVGIVGRLTEIKNHQLFIRSAAAHLQRRAQGTPARARFVIIGDGHLRAELEHETRALGIEDHVAFLGHRDDVEALYPALDIVVLSSLNEGTPLTLVEAMANGCPVVSTAVGGVVDLMGPPDGSAEPPAPENVSLYAHGALVHRNDPTTLADALDYLIDRPGARLTMGSSGREFVRRSYGLARLTKDLTRIYEDLVRPTPGVHVRHGAEPWESRTTYSHSGDHA